MPHTCDKNQGKNIKTMSHIDIYSPDLTHVKLADLTSWQAIQGFDKPDFNEVTKLIQNSHSKQIKGEIMKVLKMLVAVSMTLLLVSSAAVAGDFDWIRNFNIKAEADQSGLRARLATRFKIGDA